MVKTNVIFLGMPGSGKGTLSNLLEKRTDIIQISTGDIFREEIQKQSELGIKVKQLVESGAYVPDDITNEIVKNKIQSLEKQNKKFILDGFPRTIQQAMFLDDLNFNDYVVIYLDINEDIIIKRLSERFFCPTCKKSYNLSSFRSKKHPHCENDETLLIQRADDQPNSVKKRLDIYNEQTKPLIDFYKSKNKLYSIQTNSGIDDTVNKILDIIM